MTLHCFPHCVSCWVGCFHLFYPITNYWKIFARNSYMLLRIDHISTCIIHFKVHYSWKT